MYVSGRAEIFYAELNSFARSESENDTRTASETENKKKVFILFQEMYEKRNVEK